MSDYLSDVLATDAALDLLGARDLFDTDDAVLAGLACLACAVDEHPLPQPVAIVVRPPQQARKCGWALSVTVAITLASSGVAAAVADDPLAPFHFVQSHVTFLQQDPPTGWDLDGSGVVSTLPKGAAAAPATPLAKASMGTRGVAASGKVRTPAAGEVPGSGSGSSGAGSGRPTPTKPGHGGSGGHGGGGGNGGNGGGGGNGHPKPPSSPKGPPAGGHQDPGVHAPPVPVSGSPTPPTGGVPGRPTTPIAPIRPVASLEIVPKQPATTPVTPALAVATPASITLSTPEPTLSAGGGQ